MRHLMYRLHVNQSSTSTTTTELSNIIIVAFDLSSCVRHNRSSSYKISKCMLSSIYMCGSRLNSEGNALDKIPSPSMRIMNDLIVVSLGDH